MHRYEVDTARSLIDEAQSHLDVARSALADHPDMLHAGFVHDAEKELAEARITFALVTEAPMPSLDDVGVPPAAFLKGMAESIGELRRHILDLMRRGDLKRCEDLLSWMDDLYFVLVSMDYPDGITLGLRRLTDVARSIIERTRGDFTTSTIQSELRAALDEHVTAPAPVMSKNFWVAAGIVGLIGIVVLILATGGGPSGTSVDPAGDVAVGEGPKPPQESTLADIVGATVTKDGQELEFEVTLGQDIPNRIPKGSLEFRWDVSENGTDTWIVSANLNVGPTAAVTSQKTNYGSSTIDDSMPGSIEITGDTLVVIVRAAEIEGFPQLFEWTLKTSLDADRADPRSGLAIDQAPDSGRGRVED